MLKDVDLTKKVSSKSDYKKELKELQYKLLDLQQKLRNSNLGCVLVFEGWDASGKGGAIKRLTEKLDPRGIEVHATAAPTDDEKKFHYMYRFWTRLPRYGKIGIFDRSWYGRVLVERVENFATKKEWKQAYKEICDFESSLVNNDYLVLKFWMHISNDVQLERFHERETNDFKKWKITDEDWRNREKWPLYEEAADEMIQLTNAIPWNIIESNCKKYARLKVLKMTIKHLEKFLKERTVNYQEN